MIPWGILSSEGGRKEQGFSTLSDIGSPWTQAVLPRQPTEVAELLRLRTSS